MILDSLPNLYPPFSYEFTDDESASAELLCGPSASASISVATWLGAFFNSDPKYQEHISKCLQSAGDGRVGKSGGLPLRWKIVIVVCVVLGVMVFLVAGISCIRWARWDIGAVIKAMEAAYRVHLINNR
jgi:hypothetical protein